MFTVICQHSFHIIVSFNKLEIILNAKISLLLVPDLAIITHFNDLDLLFTTDFYCLLRGFLEKNLGDALIPVPETIPVELLQNPDRTFDTNTTAKYITFSHRMVFKDVKFHFLLPEEKDQNEEFNMEISEKRLALK